MPLYEYSCKKCGHEFEALTSYSGADQVACEQCHSPKAERLASSFASSVDGGFAASQSFGPCGSAACLPSG